MSDQQNLVLEDSVLDERAKSRRRYTLAGLSTFANVGSKGLSLLVLYISVPLTISYLGQARFGVWMTLASLISFLGFLDFGIGSSLLNEVAHHGAQEDRERLKQVITHGLLLLTFLGVVLGSVLYNSARYLPLQALFDSKAHIDKVELRNAAQALAVMIGFSLPLVGIQRVFAGLQRAFFYHIMFGIGSLISLGLLVMLSRQHAPIDELLMATFGVQLLATAPLLGVLAQRGLLGEFERIAFKMDARALLKQGGLFFILAIGGAVAWDSDFVILSKAVGAGEVAVYAVAVRLFQLIELPLQMANQPLWSAYADAKACGSKLFLKLTLKRAFWGTVAAAAVGVSFLVISREFILRIWIHHTVEIPFALALTMAAWTTIRSAGNSFAMYLNGVQIVRQQVVLVISFCIIAVPLKIFAADHYGAAGMVVACIVSYAICVIVPYLTVYRRDWSAY
jgi:O-antigen/teichoic acid export membrane protein